jgi:hypothetical protein
MRRAFACGIASMLALFPAQVHATSAWGSPEYGDPPGWCTNLSDMWVAKVVTNDPHVATNPEANTFSGFYANPGYDDWYGFFYGDFRGAPGDSSGWVKLLHEYYPHHYHWNFADNGWAVHGHAKQYIAYYNWTFGGQCGIGRYGGMSVPPYMADQVGYPVVDIYVDSVPPFAPRPYLMDIATTSVSFTWDPVADQGDGAGADYFVSGMDHYVSWLTLNRSSSRLQLASTSSPRTLMMSGLSAHQTACVHVQAIDRVGNATADQVACAAPLSPPPMPSWAPLHYGVAANPVAPGLVGLDSWMWLAPAPNAMAVDESYEGVQYRITATPMGADWDFGDGATASYPDTSGFGQAYPQPSTVTHVYEAHSQSGYLIKARVHFAVTWTALVNGRSYGPYPLGAVALPVTPLVYPVQQAQPVLIQV